MENILLCMSLFLAFFILLIYDVRNCIAEFIIAGEEEKVPRTEPIFPQCANSIFLSLFYFLFFVCEP